VDSISTPRTELYFWLTIPFSQMTGMTLIDWAADTADLGYLCAAAIFGELLVTVRLLYFTRISCAVLFWSTFMRTHPFGAAAGDFLDKPVA
jgi:uncharacterized membrane-anchored protein